MSLSIFETLVIACENGCVSPSGFVMISMSLRTFTTPDANESLNLKTDCIPKKIIMLLSESNDNITTFLFNDIRKFKEDLKQTLSTNGNTNIYTAC